MEPRGIRKHSNRKKAVLSQLIGLFAGITSLAAGLAVSAFILWKIGTVQANVLTIVSTLVCIFSTFIAGLMVGHYRKQNGLLFGALNGLLFVLLLWIVQTINNAAIPTNTSFWMHCCAMIFSSAIGGLLSVNKRVNSK